MHAPSGLLHKHFKPVLTFIIYIYRTVVHTGIHITPRAYRTVPELLLLMFERLLTEIIASEPARVLVKTVKSSVRGNPQMQTVFLTYLAYDRM